MVLEASPRILSVQSHVVSGYCGNRSATFPLQLLEFEVDVVNSVQLSNHTQYDTFRGQIFASKDLQEIHFGLKANNLISLYDHIISGYVADVSYIEALADLIKDIKSERRGKNLDSWYTLDPVLGDDEPGFYVPNGEKIAQAYKDNLLPLADIITPNRFEASILSGVEIDNKSDNALNQALEAIEIFHQQRVKVVVLTSFEKLNDKGWLTCLLSYNPSSLNSEGFDVKRYPSKPELWSIRLPKLDCRFTGTGDLFSALLTGWLNKTSFNFKKSFENTANSIHEVLEDTLSWAKHINDGSSLSQELRLVQNKTQLMCPNVRFQAEKIV